MSSGQRINRLVKGDTPSLLETEKGNELIDALNALQNIQIRYGESFQASYGSNGVTLTIPKPEESDTEADLSEYEELTLGVCIDGEVTERQFLVRQIPVEE
tara:strand:+ start:363 stop:665 length:303 start_codon:yes stop_codon:yes gene_type:complete